MYGRNNSRANFHSLSQVFTANCIVPFFLRMQTAHVHNVHGVQESARHTYAKALLNVSETQNWSDKRVKAKHIFCLSFVLRYVRDSTWRRSVSDGDVTVSLKAISILCRVFTVFPQCVFSSKNPKSRKSLCWCVFSKQSVVGVFPFCYWWIYIFNVNQLPVTCLAAGADALLDFFISLCPVMLCFTASKTNFLLVCWLHPVRVFFRCSCFLDAALSVKLSVFSPLALFNL